MSVLEEMVKGTHPFSERLSSAQRPMIVIGSEALQRGDGSHIQTLVQELSSKLSASCDDPTWKVYNVLHKVGYPEIMRCVPASEPGITGCYTKQCQWIIGGWTGGCP